MNEHRIRPIHSDEDYEAALARVEALMDLDRTQSQDDELDILATLIEVFEDRQFPMDQPDPIEAIKFRMEQMDIKQSFDAYGVSSGGYLKSFLGCTVLSTSLICKMGVGFGT